MKAFICFFMICLLTGTAYSQHYYTDMLANTELVKKRALYKQNQVKGVHFASFDNANQPIEGFECEAFVNNGATEVRTVTTTSLTGTTENTTFYNAKGQLARSIDTADGNKTELTYGYNAANQLTIITSIATSPGNYITKEQHFWYYAADGRPEKMLKVKNDADTTYITFVRDEKGNIAEEKSMLHGNAQPTVYYYYDDENRLTDIVRYNQRAKRLLPDYIFEYDAQNRLSTMLVTTEGTGDYQKWYYTYNDKGLKIKDECYSKTKVLVGKIEYRYQF